MNDVLRDGALPPGDEDLTPVADWALALLEASGPASGAFRAQCLRAAEVAFTLACLRQAAEQVGASPVGVRSFLRGLAGVVQRPLEPALHWAGLQLDGLADPGFAAAWARLAQALRLGLQEAWLHFRLTFAEDIGLEPPPALARQRAAGAGPVARECEELLDREEARWDAAVLARLRAGEAALREGYRTAAATEGSP